MVEYIRIKKRKTKDEEIDPERWAKAKRTIEEVARKNKLEKVGEKVTTEIGIDRGLPKLLRKKETFSTV